MDVNETVRVLLVDQLLPARKAVARAIRQEKRIQILDYASSGYEAVTKAITQKPDVVLMSAGIETKMAGIFVCNEISVNTPDIKVVLYGEDCPKEIVVKAFQMGATNFLLGGYTDQELTGAVLDAHDGKPSIHHSTAAQLRGEFKRIMDLHGNLIYMLNVIIKLTPTEITILRHYAGGIRSQEISKILFISNTTMKTHVSHILKKFNLDTMAQVVEVLRLTELFSMINPGDARM